MLPVAVTLNHYPKLSQYIFTALSILVLLKIVPKTMTATSLWRFSTIMLFILIADVLVTEYIYLKKGKLEICQRKVGMGECMHPIVRDLWGKNRIGNHLHSCLYNAVSHYNICSFFSIVQVKCIHHILQCYFNGIFRGRVRKGMVTDVI